MFVQGPTYPICSLYCNYPERSVVSARDQQLEQGHHAQMTFDLILAQPLTDSEKFLFTEFHAQNLGQPLVWFAVVTHA